VAADGKQLDGAVSVVGEAFAALAAARVRVDPAEWHLRRIVDIGEQPGGDQTYQRNGEGGGGQPVPRIRKTIGLTAEEMAP
jgi:hypothetical protein